jgi:hypothetical protein
MANGSLSLSLSLEREEVPPTKNTVPDALRGVARQGDWPDVIHSVDLSVQTKRKNSDALAAAASLARVKTSCDVYRLSKRSFVPTWETVSLLTLSTSLLTHRTKKESRHVQA